MIATTALDTDCLTGSLFDRWLSAVCPARREKVNRCRFDRDRRLSLGAGILLSRALGNFGLTDGAVVPDENGKPYLPGETVCFSLSHSAHFAVCTVSSCPVGVDIEEIAPVSEALISRVCTPREREIFRNAGENTPELFCRLWTAKESVLKCTGAGLTVPPEKIEVALSDPPQVICTPFPGKFFLRQYRVEDCFLTVCTRQYFPGQTLSLLSPRELEK